MSKRTSHRNSEEGELPPVPTDVRFSLQGLLVTTGVVAVAAAGLGSVFRRVAPDLRPAVLTSWCLCLALTSGLLAFHAFRRWRLERAAGRVIASLMPRGTFGHTSRPWMVVAGGLALIGLGLYYIATAAAADRRGWTAATKAGSLGANVDCRSVR